MIPQIVAERMRAEEDGMPERMRAVGRFLRAHPEDVALLSMREQARRAGVTPAAMTRFAQRLGFSGYEELKAHFAASIRDRASDFSTRAGELAARRARLGETPLAASLAEALIERVAALAEQERLSQLVAAAARLAAARRIFCLGHRSSYAPAFHFAYVAGLHGAPTVLLDAPGGTGPDAISRAGPDDVVLAVSFAPYTRTTVDVAAQADREGAAVIALTDSATSPLAAIAATSVVVPTDVPGVTHVASPAFAAAELLAALVIARAGPEGREALERTEASFARRAVYWIPGTRPLR